MNEYESLSHTTWDCKYHVVFIPKCRRKTLYQELRRHLGEVFRRLALQKELKVEEGHLMLDHVHMLLSIPPKYAVSQVVGFIKGKSAIHMARVYGAQTQFRGAAFLGPGLSSTRSGATKKPSAPTSAIKRRRSRQEQMNLWRDKPPLAAPNSRGRVKATLLLPLRGRSPESPRLCRGILTQPSVRRAGLRRGLRMLQI